MSTATDRYTKLPVTIKAKRFAGGFASAQEINAWIDDHEKAAKVRGRTGSTYSSDRGGYDRFTLHRLDGGDTEVRPGEYVILGSQGELSVCRPDIFEATHRAGEAKLAKARRWWHSWYCGYAVGCVVMAVLAWAGR